MGTSLRVEASDGRTIDLGRDVHAVLGLPFDAIDLAGTVAHLRRAAAQRERCFLSTPNVNWVVAAREDAAFRASVLRSDLCVADGMPVAWIARLIGAPLRQRVAGSEVFDRLREPTAGAPLRVFFLGGPPGAASAAAEALNRTVRGAIAVGHDAAGFGSVEAMSSPLLIDRINTSSADFLVVAMGARKGQEWLLRNQANLDVPLLCHLGATINFVAGRIRQAPKLLRRTGFEWLWRIVEEPALWKRYASDGWALATTLLSDVLPWLLARHVLLGAARRSAAPTYRIEESPGDVARLHLAGPWNAADLTALRADLARVLSDGRTVQVDLAEATSIDTRVAGLLLLVEGWQALPPLTRGAPCARAVQLALRAMGCLPDNASGLHRPR
jgi:N-acetylglucosaminyldiphosphoundecaprenol N-acetyl-beta-D-mannosaminyltransferase